MESEKNTEDNDTPKFNMALDILKSAEETMRLIRNNDIDYQVNLTLRLGRKLSLIKSYFEIISPLLEDIALNYSYIHNIRLPSRPKVRSGIKIGDEYCYDINLDEYLGGLLIKLRLELQKKGFCMPPQDEGGLF